MMNFNANTAFKLKGLGIYQIAGGAAGAIVIFWGLLNSKQPTELTIIFYSSILLFFAFSIYCGILCLTKNSKAFSLSLINQIIQIVGFAISGFAFQYVAGIFLTVGFDITESFKLTFYAGFSKFNFSLNDEPQRFEVAFNFIAYGLIIFIEKLKKQIKEEQEKKQIQPITD
jgi:hypothetical protein